MRQGIFLPESTFSVDSYGVCKTPCAIACIYICVHVKDPAVHVRVWWIMETLKHPACTVGWVARLLQLAFLRKSNSNFLWEKSHWDSSQGKFGSLSPGKASCDSRTTQPTVHAGCFSVSIIHRTLTWTTALLTCAQLLMHAVAHGSVWTLNESVLRVDSGRKIPCRTGESNLPQQHDGLMLYQLSYIPAYMTKKVELLH